MATHSSIFTWKSPWTEEPGRLQLMESQRVGQDLAIKQLQQNTFILLKIISQIIVSLSDSLTRFFTDLEIV